MEQPRLNRSDNHKHGEVVTAAKYIYVEKGTVSKTFIAVITIDRSLSWLMPSLFNHSSRISVRLAVTVAHVLISKEDVIDHAESPLSSHPLEGLSVRYGLAPQMFLIFFRTLKVL